MHILLMAFLLTAHHPVHSQCGKERWAVKTLQDSGVSSITIAPVSATITELRSITAPPGIKENPNTRVAPTETTRYEIRAILKGYKLETDSDYHLVLQDPNAPVTMIGEIPLGVCSSKEIASTLTQERTWLVKTFGRPRERGRMLWLRKPALVDIEGVGFFDFLHGQTGVAPNGIEIHPILSIKKVQ